MIKDSIKMSWNNIIHNKMRSFLTILGIVIGVASIIALITIVQGATGSITEQISSLGADKLMITTVGTTLKQGLNENDLNAMSEIEYINGISPSITGTSDIARNSKIQENVSIEGKNQTYFAKEAVDIASGRGLNLLDIENETKVAVIGNDIARELFFGQNPIGEKIKINRISYEIVGLLEPSGVFTLSSTNNSVMIPYTSAMKTLGNRNITSVDVYMADTMRSDEIISDMENVLNEAFNYHDEAFRVINMEDMISAIGDITGMMSLLLAGIASISLVVGGIGIMNMMLVSVTERTTEIGLRKALGAEPNRIQLQFLIESIFLSVFGGIMGLLLGVAIAYIASLYIGFTVTITANTILLAVGFSAAIGIIFGLTPARKASKLNPIDALRHV